MIIILDHESPIYSVDYILISTYISKYQLQQIISNFPEKICSLNKSMIP